MVVLWFYSLGETEISMGSYAGGGGGCKKKEIPSREVFSNGVGWKW